MNLFRTYIQTGLAVASIVIGAVSEAANQVGQTAADAVMAASDKIGGIR